MPNRIYETYSVFRHILNLINYIFLGLSKSLSSADDLEKKYKYL